MVAEGGDLVVVDTKLVGHVDAEPLRAHLQGQQNTGSLPSSFTLWPAYCWRSYRLAFSEGLATEGGRLELGSESFPEKPGAENLPGPLLPMSLAHSPPLCWTLRGQVCSLVRSLQDCRLPALIAHGTQFAPHILAVHEMSPCVLNTALCLEAAPRLSLGSLMADGFYKCPEDPAQLCKQQVISSDRREL